MDGLMMGGRAQWMDVKYRIFRNSVMHILIFFVHHSKLNISYTNIFQRCIVLSSKQAAKYDSHTLNKYRVINRELVISAVITF